MVKSIPVVTLIAWKGAAKLESLGMQHSSASRRGGIRVTAMAKKFFGWPMNMKKAEVARRLEVIVEEVLATHPRVTTIEVEDD
tara:strand:+ start:165 stop:413 length:249 start_codon:yes stop_codon:yes gene_type:complete